MAKNDKVSAFQVRKLTKQLAVLNKNLKRTVREKDQVTDALGETERERKQLASFRAKAKKIAKKATRLLVAIS